MSSIIDHDHIKVAVKSIIFRNPTEKEVEKAKQVREQ
jgi:hypothetical protein